LRQLITEANPKVVAIDLSAVFDLEYTALKALSEGEKRFRDRGVLLWLIGLNPGVLRTVQKSSLGGILGREAMHFNLEVTLAKYLALSATSTGATTDRGGLAARQ
jgi:anti-anti-sigma regulatory factor